MRKTISEEQPILDGIAHSAERSSLFWWLHDRHDEILVTSGGRRIRWVPHLPRFAALGLRDGEGSHVTARTASDTWAEVKRYVAQTRAAQAEQTRKPQPSRMPADWRPQPTAPPPVKPSDKPSDNTGDLSAAEANLASIRRFIKSRSG